MRSARCPGAELDPVGLPAQTPSYHHPNCPTDNRERLMFSHLHLLKSCLTVRGSFKFSQNAQIHFVTAPLHPHQFSWTSSFQLVPPSPRNPTANRPLRAVPLLAPPPDDGLGVGQEPALRPWQEQDARIGKLKSTNYQADPLFPGNQGQKLSPEQGWGTQVGHRKTLSWLYSQLLPYISRS